MKSVRFGLASAVVAWGAFSSGACSAGGAAKPGGAAQGGSSSLGASAGQSSGGSAGDGLQLGGSGGAGACAGATCGAGECEGKPKTTVRATIYDPSGNLPLYNVMVYVPSAELTPIVEGVTCDRCDATATGKPVAAALTDPHGEFVMEDVPSGAAVPMVIQMGKWRRQVTLPSVLPCQENVFSDKELFRLPRNQAEGHLPKIAMTTGGADKLECVMRRIGIDDAEFTNPDGPGRINLYNETGASAYAAGGDFPLVTELIGSLERLEQYDVVIMSCHGDSGHGREQPTAEKELVKQYVDKGGRVFGSHFHYSYLRADDDSHLPTPFPDVGMWDGDAPETYSIETGFPKGQAFAEWLVHVGASSTLGSIGLSSVEGAASVLDTPYTQRWIYADNTVPYFTMSLPIEKLATPDEQCGRFVHTGIHISGSETEDPFPGGCEERAQTPQEMALEFLLFDLSACPLRIDTTPMPPVIVK